ncbi:beta-lactamase-domain-containing protein [Sordaria brevicollis]|uniref:Beta-lactamase-domain-containing protein n=1 Tax=Sordaria brevicollis TaxID=83679 RepID=A0AAE0PMD0_SORBR|nr:beta-lactamase-domain-containing protein [Sordaria brevicollis]
MFRLQEEDIRVRLQSVIPIVDEILKISGAPSASVGILHENNIIFTKGHGTVAANEPSYKQRPPGPNTIYGIGSMTKSFVVASLAKIRGEGREAKFEWSTPMKDLLEDFETDNKIAHLATLSDFLSHRTGLSGDMSIAYQGDLKFLLTKPELLRAVATLEKVGQFRSDWIYNNWGYSLAGLVLERFSGMSFEDCLREYVADPLSLHSTTTRPDIHGDFAFAHAALDNNDIYPLPEENPFKESIFETAGGIYSSVNDLLAWAKAILAAEHKSYAGPLKEVPTILSNQVPLDNPSRDHRFYGFGWVRTALPDVVGLQGDNAELFKRDQLPILGSRSQPMMTYYHQGAGLGYYSAIFMFPDTNSSVVVLTNSMPLNDVADWIAQVYITALFGFEDGGTTYHEAAKRYLGLAKRSRDRKLGLVKTMMTALDNERSMTCSYPHLDSYIGQYHNSNTGWPGNFFIDICYPEEEKKRGCLELRFQGRKSQAYELRHMKDDTFEWALDYNQQAKRARFTIWDPEYFKIYFNLDRTRPGGTVSLNWARDSGLPGRGMVLTRRENQGGRAKLSKRHGAIPFQTSFRKFFPGAWCFVTSDMSGMSSGAGTKSNDHFAESTGGRSQPWKSYQKDPKSSNNKNRKPDYLVVQSGSNSGSGSQDDVCKECGKRSGQCECGVGFIAA